MIIKSNYQLQQYNSFRTKAEAKLFVEINNIDQLKEIIKLYPNENKLVLGNGCNLFFTHNFDGLIIKPIISGINIISETIDSVYIEAGAGQDWDALVEYCVNKGWSGIENLSLIPGSVGAAPIQNIGAYGTEVNEVITEVRTVDIPSAEEKIFKNEECGFDYRNSIFKQTRNYVITSVVFRLNKSFTYKEKYTDLNNELKNITSPSLSQVREAIIRIRKRKLPNHIELPNAGSFFKNPIINKEASEHILVIHPNAPIYEVGNNLYKTSAAFLIENVGYKGKLNLKENVGTYKNHALIIVNYGTDNGNDITEFMQEIQSAVKMKYNIQLEPEVWIF